MAVRVPDRGKVLQFAVGLSDAAERARALDVQASWIVEAPAGSGKTGLLMQRLLKLLASDGVSQPEEVLAITFTRKATAELRERVLGQLHAAQKPLAEGADAFQAETYALAAAVCERDRRLGWMLLEQPQRLQVRTIDSLCAEIAGTLPLLSGSGDGRKPVEQAEPLYRAAAERTLLQLGGADGVLSEAIRTLLLHRDGNLSDCQTLLARMLGAREQWASLVPLGRGMDAATLQQSRARLEASLAAIVCDGLARASRAMPPDLMEALAWLAARMAGNAGYRGALSPIAICAARNLPPEEKAEHLEHWLALTHLLLTREGGWRADSGLRVNTLGFEATAEDRTELKAVLAELRDDEDLREALCEVRALPPAHYPDEQWQVAEALFRVLGHALAELRVLFAERGECDFAEMSIAAKTALRADVGGGDLAGAAGMALKHLLVDEMQDTSAAQYELIELLTRSWDGHSQTLFLVGDPKQSIYLFRQARVERFLRTMREERLGDVPVRALRLLANFRSQAGLVQGFNADFEQMFPAPESLPANAMALDVPFVRATATRGADGASQGRVWHAAVLGEGPGDEAAGADWNWNRAQTEAAEIRAVIEKWRRREPLEKDGTTRGPWKIAVLARNREHLTHVIREFRREDLNGHRIPYRAREVERLGDQPEVIDALALTRALSHAGDRIAWLSVLRAPWCGLGMADLLAIAGGGSDSSEKEALLTAASGRRHLLSADGLARFERAWPILQAAFHLAGRTSLALHAERTWVSLGGSAALQPEEAENVALYFEALRAVEEPGGRVDIGMLTERVGKLYARPSLDDAAVDLMTMHGAKGLEWDVVLLPQLQRRSKAADTELLNWIDVDVSGARATDERTSQVVLAPIHGRGEDASDLYEWLCRVRSARESAERKRLFYVACTRAREELHLFAAAKRNRSGELCGEKGSLLHSAWEAAQSSFAVLEAPADGAFKDALQRSQGEVEGSLALAASGEAEEQGGRPAELVWPVMERLPLSFSTAEGFLQAAANRLPYAAAQELAVAAPFGRPEGSYAVRAFGNVVHRFLVTIADQLRGGGAEDAVLRGVEAWGPRLRASLRAEGVSPAQVEKDANRAHTALVAVMHDPIGRWLLGPRSAAASEVEVRVEGGRTLRVDRVFRAGATALSAEETHTWIVDFKTSELGSRSVSDFEELERAKYVQQLHAYAHAYDSTGQKSGPVMLALYYPLAQHLIAWPYVAAV